MREEVLDQSLRWFSMRPADEAMRAVVNSWNATVPESLHSVEWAFIDIHQAGMMAKEALSDEVREVGE